MSDWLESAGEGRHRVELKATRLGPDFSFCLGGGQAPHIGVAALAVPRPGLDGRGLSASASVLCVTGHKEDQLARELALAAAARLDCRVLVAAGLHIDGASAEDIEILLANSRKAFEIMLERLSGAGAEEGRAGLRCPVRNGP